MQRLGKNQGRYFGDTIDIAAVLPDLERTAHEHGWQSELLAAAPGLTLLAFTRVGGEPGNPEQPPRKRIYISAGIHGDEPAGPLAVLELLKANQWPDRVDIWLCPCLNPTGFPLNRRENAQGIDLNRQYLHLEAEETRAHIDWLNRQPGFDLALCLHEDWESHGFYVYELNPDNQASFADAIVQHVAAVCPIDLSPEIEGREAHGGIIRPSADPRSRPQWPEAFYLFTHKTRLAYTLEAPSDFPLSVRVAALVTAVRTVLDSFKPV
jgi:protein MpaA